MHEELEGSGRALELQTRLLLAHVALQLGGAVWREPLVGLLDVRWLGRNVLDGDAGVALAQHCRLVKVDKLPDGTRAPRPQTLGVFAAANPRGT